MRCLPGDTWIITSEQARQIGNFEAFSVKFYHYSPLAFIVGLVFGATESPPIAFFTSSFLQPPPVGRVAFSAVTTATAAVRAPRTGIPVTSTLELPGSSNESRVRCHWEEQEYGHANHGEKKRSAIAREETATHAVDFRCVSVS